MTNRQAVERNRGPEISPGLKEKDLCGIPWRVAFALQEAGWYLRSDIIWHKPNCMPESVRDRPTRSHEYIFLLAKSEKYYYDYLAIREGEQVYTRRAGGYHDDVGTRPTDGQYRNKGGLADKDTTTVGRNKRSVWAINTSTYKGAHFATFPPKLVEPMVRAGSSEYGACPTCGSPWERMIDYKANYEKREVAHAPNSTPSKVDSSGWKEPTRKQTGWQPTCKCYGKPVEQVLPCPDCEGTGRELEWASNQFRKEEAQKTGRKDGKVQGPGGQNYKVETGEPCPACDGLGERMVKTWPAEKDSWPVVPCKVLDPFVGSGTTCVVARSLGRDSIGLDLSFQYLQDNARTRLSLDALGAWEKGEAALQPKGNGKVKAAPGQMSMFGD